MVTKRVYKIEKGQLAEAFEDAFNDILNDVHALEKDYHTITKRIANFFARSFRGQLAHAPYNYKSKKPGKWSRLGGRPLEKSIVVRRLKNGHGVYVVDKGGVDATPPSTYSRIYPRGAGKYLIKASRRVTEMYDKLLKSIIIKSNNR